MEEKKTENNAERTVTLSHCLRHLETSIVHESQFTIKFRKQTVARNDET